MGASSLTRLVVLTSEMERPLPDDISSIDIFNQVILALGRERVANEGEVATLPPQKETSVNSSGFSISSKLMTLQAHVLSASQINFLRRARRKYVDQNRQLAVGKTLAAANSLSQITRLLWRCDSTGALISILISLSTGRVAASLELCETTAASLR